MTTKTWLNIGAHFTALIGVVLAIGALIPGSFDSLGALLFPTVSEGDLAFTVGGRLMGGLMGAVMAGWGVALILIVRNLENLDRDLILRANAIGLLSWFVIDNAVSISLGAYVNVGGNIFFLALVLPPLLLLQRSGSALQVSSLTD